MIPTHAHAAHHTAHGTDSLTSALDTFVNTQIRCGVTAAAAFSHALCREREHADKSGATSAALNHRGDLDPNLGGAPREPSSACEEVFLSDEVVSDTHDTHKHKERARWHASIISLGSACIGVGQTERERGEDGEEQQKSRTRRLVHLDPL